MTIDDLKNEHIQDDVLDDQLYESLKARGWVTCEECNELFDPAKEGISDLRLCGECISEEEAEE